MCILGQIGGGGSAADTDKLEQWIYGRLENERVQMWTGWKSG
jgi:hypothetical protein